MNKWQKVYCDIYHNGKTPRSKSGKEDLALLEDIKEKVIVTFPERQSVNGIIPEHTETLIVTETDCNIPEGRISVSVLVSNLKLWKARGHKVLSE